MSYIVTYHACRDPSCDSELLQQPFCSSAATAQQLTEGSCLPQMPLHAAIDSEYFHA